MSKIKHVAIIMDGNGRWAKKRFRPRLWGHVRGSSVVSEIVETADNIGIKALTLYAFSTENWSRPLEEVSGLFKLLKKFLIKEKNRILANNIKFKVIGEIQSLPRETVSLISEMEELTKNSTGLDLTFAFNYGGRAEIVRAVNAFQLNHPDRLLTENDLESLMYRPETGDVDLMIRTGGEQRISNFLLWQMAYAELYFTPTKWPDFTSQEFINIIDHVSKRERRFGNVNDQGDLEQSIGKAKLNKTFFNEGARP
jgi:undecaprenyl diphosphate synthase